MRCFTISRFHQTPANKKSSPPALLMGVKHVDTMFSEVGDDYSNKRRGKESRQYTLLIVFFLYGWKITSIEECSHGITNRRKGCDFKIINCWNFQVHLQICPSWACPVPPQSSHEVSLAREGNYVHAKRLGKSFRICVNFDMKFPQLISKSTLSMTI